MVYGTITRKMKDYLFGLYFSLSTLAIIYLINLRFDG